MKIKWKNNKNFKPHVVLQKIEEAVVSGDDTQISFSGEEYFESMDMLQNMFDFPDGSYGVEPRVILFKAIKHLLEINKLSKEFLLEEINKIFNQNLSVRETRYYILTSISLQKPYPKKISTIEKCRIRFLEYNYSKKYSSRNEYIKKSINRLEKTPLSYARVIVSAKAKSEASAVTKALRVLDLQRSVWCLFANPWKEVASDNWKPINKIRLGEIHSLHQVSGKDSVSGSLWYEPTFVETKLFKPINSKNFNKTTKWTLEAIERVPYGNKIKDVLLRFVRALDERDQNVALLKLWGALEALASPNNAKYDDITKRVAFIFSDYHYHKQVLEYLRENRNRNVHAGDESDKARINCYRLQFYVKELIFFHLGNAGQFKSLDEANAFLDLSPDVKVLKNQLDMINKAIKFSS